MTYRTPELVFVGSAQNIVLTGSAGVCLPSCFDDLVTLSRDIPLW